MHYLLFLLICGVWGSSFILMKKAAPAMGPLTIGWGRVIGGGLILLLIWRLLLRRPGERWGVARRDWLALAVPAVVGMTYPFVMQPYLIGRFEHSGFFGMMVCLVPLLTIAVSVPMLGVWPKVRELVGVVVGFGFILLLFGAGAERGVPWQAVVLAVTVPAAYALSNTFIKRRLSHIPPVVLTITLLLAAGACITPLMLVSPMEREKLMNADAGQLAIAGLAVGVLGMIGTGLATWMFYVLVTRRGPLFAGMVTYLVSSIAVMWGWVDGEPVTRRQIVALAGVLAMVALVQWPGRPAKPGAATRRPRPSG